MKQRLIKSSRESASSSARLKRFIFAFLPTLALFVVAELLLRAFLNLPTGYFAFLKASEFSLYPPNTELKNRWGPIPYSVHANNLGLRGPDVPVQKAPGTKRIIALGDSVTDGFFVDDSDTFEANLQLLLTRNCDRRYEVINAARGGGSIDKELGILRKIALPLRPDIVILTFVSNDISDIFGRSFESLTQNNFQLRAYSSTTAFGIWLINNLAVGEALYRLYWNLAISSGHRTYQADDSRYSIPGGTDFERNAALFLEQYRDTDGLVLGDTFTPNTEQTVTNYLNTLTVITKEVSTAGAQLLFVYFPAYPQIYLPNQSHRIKDKLFSHCDALDIPFLDLTDSFQRHGRGQPLHLAPVDFHLNPEGNRVMAEAIYSFGISNKLW